MRKRMSSSVASKTALDASVCWSVTPGGASLRVTRSLGMSAIANPPTRQRSGGNGGSNRAGLALAAPPTLPDQVASDTSGPPPLPTVGPEVHLSLTELFFAGNTD